MSYKELGVNRSQINVLLVEATYFKVTFTCTGLHHRVLSGREGHVGCARVGVGVGVGVEGGAAKCISRCIVG